MIGKLVAGVIVLLFTRRREHVGGVGHPSLGYFTRGRTDLPYPRHERAVLR